MPVEHCWEPRGVYRRYRGRVTIDERRASFDAICSDRRFDDLRYTITDYLAVSSYEVRSEATEEIAALHIGPLTTNPRIVIAAVARDPQVLAAIEHFRALQFFHQPYQVFDSLADARAWLSTLGRC